MAFERVSREDRKRSWLYFAQFALISRSDADRFLAKTRSMQLRELANCRDKEGQLWIPLFSSIDHFRNIIEDLASERSSSTWFCTDKRLGTLRSCEIEKIKEIIEKQQLHYIW